MLAGLTATEIREAAEELYRPDAFRDAPGQIFLDQFEAAEPPTTFLRVSFRRFTERAVESGFLRLPRYDRPDDDGAALDPDGRSVNGVNVVRQLTGNPSDFEH